jgi:hypothetical protein
MPVPPVLTVAAASCVAVGLGFGYLGYDPIGIGLMTAALVVALASALAGLSGRPSKSNTPDRNPLRGALAGALVASFAWHSAATPGLYLDPARPLAFRIASGVGAVIAASYLLPVPAGVARLRFPFLLATMVAMSVAVVMASPAPHIDVWWLQQYAGSLILRAQNPYEFAFPNIYADDALFGPGVADRMHVFSYPYPPLTFLVGSPAVEWLQDVRFAWVTVLVLGLLAAWSVARTQIAELALACFAFQPRAFFVLEQSWNEPLVFATIALTSWAMSRRHPTSSVGLCLGALLASKQYAPLLALPLALSLPKETRARTIAVALGVAAATYAPFVLWNASELWRDVLWMQVRQPFRTDALSWLVPLARWTERVPSAGWGFAAAAAVLAATMRARSTASHAVLVAASAFLAFVLFNKQAFANYYWLASGLLALSVALAPPDSVPAANPVFTHPNPPAER